MLKFPQKIFFISLIYIASGFGLGLSIISTTELRHNLSNNYQGRSEHSSQGQEKLLNLSLSALADPSTQKKMLVAQEAINLNYFAYAKAILNGINTDEAKMLLGNAMLGQGDTLEARKIYTKINEKAKKSLYVAKTYYLEGQISQGNATVLSSLPNIEACKLFILAQPTVKSVCADLLNNDKEFNNIFKESGTAAGYGMAYNKLNEMNYAQFSLSVLEDGQARGVLSRDLLIELGRRYLELNDQSAAITAYRLALSKDPYYPQTYGQLILISQSAGDNSAADSYRIKLDSLTLK